MLIAIVSISLVITFFSLRQEQIVCWKQIFLKNGRETRYLDRKSWSDQFSLKGEERGCLRSFLSYLLVL